jgi:adenylosuccinate synthase
MEAMGFEVRSRLLLADTAHMVLPYHRLLDAAQEKLRGKGRIGTTGRGIGCAYGDKSTRIGLRLGDLRNPDTVRARLQGMASFYRPMFEHVFKEDLPSPEEVAEEMLALAPSIVPMLVDGAAWINEQADAGKKILIEGAQGVHLDIDHGTYPFVTSSNPTTGGVCTGLGLAPSRIDRVAGVTKAYTTRVGEGPFPTEFEQEFGAKVREAGAEYGATTGRPRRCGWFDAPVVKRSVMLCGMTEIVLTKIDVLDDLETIQLGTHYRCNGKELSVFPSYFDPDAEVEVVYEEMPGWQTPLGDCKTYEELPENARRYIERIEELLGIPVNVVSVGADRDGTILRKSRFFQ